MTWRHYPRGVRIGAAVTVAVAVGGAALARGVARVEVAGRSMAPALRPGDRLVVARRRAVRPGDVVAATDPRGSGQPIVKRVAGVAADGSVWLLGDNADASTDSRVFGAVPPDLVWGRVVWRYAPADRAGPLRSPGSDAGSIPPVDRDKLDKVLDEEYLAGLTEFSMEELRARRAECQALEVGLSYQRRMAQGRLDIVGAERDRRAAGGEVPAHEELVGQLSGILADRIHAPGLGRLPQLMTPDQAEVDTEELDTIVGPGRIASLPDLDDGELAELVERLSAYEAEVSSSRHEVHQRIDALQAEITRRYRTGQASVESLLG
jgi:nickel-type superoxide dismutase maturation protease